MPILTCRRVKSFEPHWDQKNDKNFNTGRWPAQQRWLRDGRALSVSIVPPGQEPVGENAAELSFDLKNSHT